MRIISENKHTQSFL